MKKLAVFIIVFVFCISCSTFGYNPETHEFWYARLGNQEIKGLTIKILPDGSIEISLDSQSADDESLQEILRIIRPLSTGGIMP